jgi:hypothetical protein
LKEREKEGYNLQENEEEENILTVHHSISVENHAQRNKGKIRLVKIT